MRHALLALAVLSGAAGLAYEVVWLRWFRLLFGSTAYAASATLCALFLGLAIGSALLGRVAGRTPRPLRLYAAIELAAAAAALLVPLGLVAYDGIYPALYASFSDAGRAFVAVKFALALIAMLPCAVLLGGTLPLLAAAYIGPELQLGRRGSVLYGANLGGGVAGAALGGLILPELIGVNGTYAIALAATLCAAAGAATLYLYFPRIGLRGVPPVAPGPRHQAASSAPLAPARALWIAGVSGFGLLAFQVLLVHALGQFFAHTVYSFGLVLVAVLLCLAVGAAFVAATESRVATPPLLGGALLLEALLLLVLPWAIVALRGGEPGSATLVGLATTPLTRVAVAIGILAVPPLLVASVVFPLTFRLVSSGPAGPRLGRLLAINTLGSIAGSLAASFWMLERLGLWGSFAVLGLMYGIAALAATDVGRTRLGMAAALSGVVAVVMALPAVNPLRLPSTQLREGHRLLAVAEGAHGLVTVVEHGDADRMIAIDNHYQFGSTSRSGLYDRMGRLPLLLHPDPRRVLVVGSATGGLAAAAVVHPVEEISLVEIVPEVQELAAAFFAEHNRGVHSDPRTRLVTEDGRNHVRAAPGRYDVIIEDLFVPQRPTAAAMYTLEHYQDAKAHLGRDGIFCQWLPIYQLSRTQLDIIVATFIDVFPEASLWTPHFRQPPIVGLVGSSGRWQSVDALAARGRQLTRSGIEDPWLYDPEGLWAFYLGPAEPLARLAPSASVNRDAFPRFEFVSARTSKTTIRNFSHNGWPGRVAEMLARAPAEDPLFPGRSVALARGGQELTRINRVGVANRGSWRRVRELLPAHLLLERDSSVSGVWPPSP